MTAIQLQVDDRVILITLAAACSGYLLLHWHKSAFVRRDSAAAVTGGSSDSAGHESAAASETARVSRLLEQQFTRSPPQDDPFRKLPLVRAMADANAEACERLALLVERHCAALTDFTGERGAAVALEVGCGVGGGAAALAVAFPRVLAVDASQRCIDAAKVAEVLLVPPQMRRCLWHGLKRRKALQEQSCLSYRALTSRGATGARRMARLGPDVDAERITFLRADPEAFVAEVDPSSADALVIAAGLLQSLPRPGGFLGAAAQLLRPSGVLAVVLDYDWDPARTQRSEWLLPPADVQQGGDGQDLAAIMETLGFVLAAEADLPTAARRDARRHTVIIQHVTLWRQRL